MKATIIISFSDISMEIESVEQLEEKRKEIDKILDGLKVIINAVKVIE